MSYLVEFILPTSVLFSKSGIVILCDIEILDIGCRVVLSQQIVNHELSNEIRKTQEVQISADVCYISKCYK